MALGAGSLEKFLSHMPMDLSADPQNPCKKLDTVTQACNPYLGTEGLLAVAGQQDSGLARDLSHTVKWRMSKEEDTRY